MLIGKLHLKYNAMNAGISALQEPFFCFENCWLDGETCIEKVKIKNFINMVSNELGLKIKWRGSGINEKAVDKYGNVIIECKKEYFRPSEVDTLQGDYSKAKRLLNWKPKHDIKSIIKDMIRYELSP